MSILVDQNTKVLVQGITGRDGSFHARGMKEYGTQIVGGVTPGKGGQCVEDIPVFNTMAEACGATGANCSVIYVPANFATSAIREAADAGVPLVICITEGVPVGEMLENYTYVKEKSSRLIGPNCPGVISPEKSKVGIMPGFIHKAGSIGVISRSGTLTYEAVDQLTKLDIGQSTCIGIGGDPVIGSNFVDLLKIFREDDKTDAVVIIGEIGGTAEEEVAEYVKTGFEKPIVSFIAGATAPPGRRMGHAGAIIAGGKGTAAEKKIALKSAGITVVDNPADIGVSVQKVLKREL